MKKSERLWWMNQYFTASGLIFPEEVPVLTATDIMKGQGNNDVTGQGCLIEWRWRVFDKVLSHSVNAILWEACQEIAVPRFSSYMDIPRWNDSHSAEQCAAAWNLAMEKLGYTEDVYE